MSNMTFRVDGLEFRVAANESEPMVRDIELAQRLGYAQPRDIRKIIKRLIEEGFLPAKDNRATVGRLERRKSDGTSTGFVDTIEYWLTEAGALKVVMRSDTKEAHKMVDFVIAVFRAAVHTYSKSEAAYLNRILLYQHGGYRKLIETEFAIDIARLHTNEKIRGWDGRGTQPVALAQVWRQMYEVLFGRTVYRALKDRNPNPSKGHNHHQMLRDDPRDILDNDMRIAHILARQSRTMTEFWRRLRAQYSKEGLQFDMFEGAQPPQ